jgi:hypothetical protein
MLFWHSQQYVWGLMKKFIKFWRVLWLRINVLAIATIKIVLNYSDVVSTSGNAVGKTVVNSSSNVVPLSSTRNDRLGKSSKYYGDFFGLEISVIVTKVNNSSMFLIFCFIFRQCCH